MLDDDFILDADESLKTEPCELTGWELVIFKIADEETDAPGPRPEA